MRVPCKRCGALVLQTTFARHGGFCVPCFRGADGRRWQPLETLRELAMLPSFVFAEVRDAMRTEAVPSDIPAAVELLVASLGVDYPCKYPSHDAFVAAEHFGLGLGIRNRWRLWQHDSPLLLSCGTDDPDAASSLILAAFWRRATASRGR